MKSPKFSPSLFRSQAFPCAITLSLLAAMPAAQAADSTWDGDTSTAWALAGNWSAGIPTGVDTATFNSTYTNQPTLLGNTTIGRLVFGSSNTNPITITTATGNNRMNIGSVSSTGIQMDSGTAAVNIGASGVGTQGASITASQNWTNNSGSLLTVNRVSVDDQSAAGTYTLTINGSGSGGVNFLNTIGDVNNLSTATNLFALQINSTGGNTTLSSNNTYTGGTVLSQGNLRVGAGGALGSGIVALNGGKLSTEGTSSRTLANAVTIGGNVAMGDVTDSGKLTFSTTVDLGGANRTLTTASNLEISGVVSNGGITKLGDGVMTLSGTNTYTGATAVNGGKLTFASTGTINGTSGVSIGAGEFNYNSSTSLTQGVSFSGTGGTLSGTGTITTSVNVTNGNTLAIGNTGAAAMTFGSDLTIGGTLLHELTGGGNTADLGDVTGNLVLNGILDLVQLGTYTAGNKFTLFAYDGALTGLFKDFGGINTIADDATFTDAGGLWKLDYNDTAAGLNGGIGAAYVTITAVPEPGTALLGGLGMLALLRLRRCA